MLKNKKKYLSMTKDFLFPMGISAVVATLLTPSLGTQKDLHASLRVQKPQEVSVSQVAENAPRLSPMNHQNDFIGFKEKMGYRESRNNYFITNPYGHVGKYQFGKSALKFYGVSQSEFLSSPALQESVFYASLAHNKWKLQHEITTFAGKNFAGITVTESGILAAAHLLGANSVKTFFKSEGKASLADANGTSIINYMKSFQHFDLSNIKASKYDGRKLI